MIFRRGKTRKPQKARAFCIFSSMNARERKTAALSRGGRSFTFHLNNLLFQIMTFPKSSF